MVVECWTGPNRCSSVMLVVRRLTCVCFFSWACCPSWIVGLGQVVDRGWDELPGLTDPLFITLPFAWDS